GCELGPNCRLRSALRPWWRGFGRRRCLLGGCWPHCDSKRSDGSSEQQMTSTCRAYDHDDPPFRRPFPRRRSRRRLIPKVERRRAGRPLPASVQLFPLERNCITSASFESVCRLRGSETGYVEPSAHSQIGAIDPKPTCGDALLDHMEANKAFGGIDILINNAGAYEAGPWIR